MQLPKPRSLQRTQVILLALLQFFIMAGSSTQLSSLEIFLTENMHFTTAKAFATLAMFLSPMLILPLISGYIGDRFFGHYRTVLFGLLLELVGFILFAQHPEHYLFWSLALIQCGVNLILPNMFVIVGQCMPATGTERDSGFMVNYAGMNAGAFVSMFASGYIIAARGYSMLCWYSAALVATTIILLLAVKRFITDQDERKPVRFFYITLGLSALAVVIAHTLLVRAEEASIMLIVAGCIGFCVVLYLIFKSGHEYKQKLTTFLGLSLICVGFVAFYYLTPNLIINFINTNVEHRLFGFFIPTQSMYVFSPLFVIVFALLASWFWVTLKKKNININIPGKIFIGLTFLTLGYFVLFFATTYTEAGSLSAMGWIIAFFALQSIGEICVIPLGFAMVGVLAPKKYEGVLQGVWALTIGLALGISSFIARESAYPSTLSPAKTAPLYADTFWIYTVVLAAIAAITLALIPQLTKAFVASNKQG